MDEFNLTPQTQGIIEDAKNLATLLERDGVDIDLFFYEFLRKKTAFINRFLEKYDLVDALESVSQEIAFSKKPTKKTSTRIREDVFSVISDASRLAIDSFGLDYIPPECIFLSFFSDHQPKALKIFNKKEPEAFSVFFDGLVQEFTVYCLDAPTPDDPSFEESGEGGRGIDTPEDWIDMFDDNPILSQFAENLNAKAANQEFDEIVDFDNKIGEIATILCRKKKPNAILVGPAGTGKTSIVESLATKIVRGEAPELLSNKVIYSLSLSSMVAGTEYRGQFEKRLEDFVNEAKKYSNLVLFIDEIHTLVGAGGGSNSNLEASNILKPELARGTISCIGATTIEEYKSSIKNDAALDRRFEKVFVREPSRFQMQEILPVVFSHYEEFHGVVYAEDFRESILDFCENFLPNKRYPDKAIDVVDQCAAKAKVDFWRIDKSISAEHTKRLDEADESEHEEIFNDFKDKISDWFEKNRDKVPQVEIEHLKMFIDQKTNILSSPKSINSIFDGIAKETVGAGKLLSSLKEKINCSNLYTNDNFDKSKSNVFLVFGDEGCGKSFFMKKFAEGLDREGGDTIAYNGSFFAEPAYRFRIISDDPSKNSLCERVKVSQNASIFIDDFDLVNKYCLDIFADIFKNGKLESESGEIIDFSNCKFFLSCKTKPQPKSMGFLGDKDTGEHIFKDSDLVSKDHSIVFNNLTKHDLKKILLASLKKTRKNLLLNGFDLRFSLSFLKDCVNNLNKKNPKSLSEFFNDNILKYLSKATLSEQTTLDLKYEDLK
tara:strand:- start:436 stop:2757 length:2322 start_codon:yes stop_codon:yes gene_type:complete